MSSATTTMAASPWAKEWKNLANDSMAPMNSQKAILLATFYKSVPRTFRNGPLINSLLGVAQTKICRTADCTLPLRAQ
jgi:hypothetical protein